MNKKTRSLTLEEFELIIDTVREGFILGDIEHRGNKRIATILTLQGNLGLRIGDILKLKINDIVKDNLRYRLNIVEQKTGKERSFTVPKEIYSYLILYYKELGIGRNKKLFDISERAIQKHLSKVCEYLDLYNVSTHSFRKFFATSIYINNDYDIGM